MKAIKPIHMLLAVLLLFSACQKSEDYSLSGTVFIQDPYYPGLPIYSEWGYNTFGAYIDRKPFVSTNDELPAKVIVNNDTVHLMLRGIMSGQKVDLTFSFDGFSPQTYYDLIQLDNTTINLKDIGRKVTLKIGTTVTVLNLIEGELVINKVQRLYVDETLSRTIMSGYFNLKTFLNAEPISISQGRFDLGIGYENFYNF